MWSDAIVEAEVDMKAYRIGILGATGLVGQRLIERLADHPWFRVTAVAASERSAGRSFAEAVSWRLPTALPPRVASQTVRECRVDQLQDCDLVLSALDAPIASDLEPRFAEAGFPVISNSSAFRQHDEVPLVVPEVNASHLVMLDPVQERNGGGFIVTNPNCSTTGLVLAMAPLHRRFGIERMVVSTLQAVSGAGIEGPRALEMLDNVVPYIPGEEEKIEREMGKILGSIEGSRLQRAELAVSAHCHRVATTDGHLEAVSVGLSRRARQEEVIEVLAEFRGEIEGDELPSATAPAIMVRHEPDRPQPKLDRDTGDGMTVVVGRVRPCPVLDFKIEVLSHNTVRGAAGGTLLNAELLASRGRLVHRSTA
jgi:aspartate-semialdehyde dehydrogenase